MRHYMFTMELVSMDFVNIRPTKIEATDRPPNKLNAYKNPQKSSKNTSQTLPKPPKNIPDKSNKRFFLGEW